MAECVVLQFFLFFVSTHFNRCIIYLSFCFHSFEIIFKHDGDYNLLSFVGIRVIKLNTLFYY